MKGTLAALTTLGLVATACATSSSYDRAWAECEEEALEEVEEDYSEFSLEDQELRRRQFVRECMEEQGLEVKIEEEDDDEDDEVEGY